MKIRLNSLGVTLTGLLSIANILGLIYLGFEAFGVSLYLSGKSSFSVAETSYLGALWTSVAAKACMGILLDLIMLGWIFLNIELHDPRIHEYRDQVICELKALQDKPVESKKAA